MRQFAFIACVLLLSGAGKADAVRYALRFGATPTSPIGPPVPCAHPTASHELCPYLEHDYVPQFETVVPQAIKSCGATFVRFEPLTDGAERAYFDARADQAAVVVDCLKKHFPHGAIDQPNSGRPL